MFARAFSAPFCAGDHLARHCAGTGIGGHRRKTPTSSRLEPGPTLPSGCGFVRRYSFLTIRKVEPHPAFPGPEIENMAGGRRRKFRVTGQQMLSSGGDTTYKLK